MARGVRRFVQVDHARAYVLLEITFEGIASGNDRGVMSGPDEHCTAVNASFGAFGGATYCCCNF